MESWTSSNIDWVREWSNQDLHTLTDTLEMTDIELQKTNSTLRRLSEEMRSYSMEKSKEKEEELRSEVDRIQSEIKILQKTNEDSATISDKLSREVGRESCLSL